MLSAEPKVEAGNTYRDLDYLGYHKNLIIIVFFFTALFTNMRVLKFKSQLTIALFAAVNHLNGPLGKQNFTLTGSKGQGL